MPETTCTACGAPMQPGLKFCGGCGAKQESAPLPPVSSSLSPASPPASLRFWDYLIMSAIFAVPLIGALIASMWAFGWALGKQSKKNRKDFALAQFILKAAFILAFLVFYFINFSAMNEFFKVMLS